MASKVGARWPTRHPSGILMRMGVELPEDLQPDWTTTRDEHGGREVVALVRKDFADRFRKLGLLHAADRPPSDLAPGARPYDPPGGRGSLAVVPAGPEGEVVVRPYRRGGFAARFSERTYLLGDRAFDEAIVTERLRRREVPTVVPLAAVQSRPARSARPGYRAALVTRRVTGADPAPAVLARTEGAALDDVLRRMGRSTGRLHDAGGVHVDLNAHNFLIPHGRGDAVLLDFDRARILTRDPLGYFAGQNLSRLRRHLKKLDLDRALEAWDSFEAGYRETHGD